ncbi:histidine kinase [Micromonospora sp. NPDC050686]|uniref:sensor histidine kinase n=1 Tax=Micromonospora sp. NPDC050686 TaxID=3154631 RepID=UPI0033D22BA8
MARWTGRGAPLLSVLVGFSVAALSLVMAFMSLPGGRAVPLGLGVLGAHAALLARRAAPRAAFGVVCVALAVQAAASGLFLIMPSVLVFPSAIYSLGIYASRRFAAAGLAVAAVAAVLAALRLVNDPSVTAAGLRPNPFLVCGLLVAVVVAAWILGLYRRTQLAYLALLEERSRQAAAEQEERARRAVLDERNRIARDMHDVVAHSLSVILSQAKGGQFLVRNQPERAAEILATIENAGRLALTDMRGLLGVLRSAEPDSESREPQPGLRDLPQLLDRVRAAGLPVSHHEQGLARPVTPGAELAIFRTVQEALTNTVKHAGPDGRAVVTVSWAVDGLSVTVRDRGNRDGVPAGTGHGLIGMRERISAAGGSLSAGPADGGFLVTARLPYAVPADEAAA